MLVLALTVALAADLNSCVERAAAAMPQKERAQLSRWLRGGDPKPGLDELEKRAMAEHERAHALLIVAEDAARAGQTERAARIAAQMEVDARATRPVFEMEIVRRETQLARANAAAQRTDAARAHLAAARALLPQIGAFSAGSAHHAIHLVALALHDEALAKSEEEAFFAAERARRDEPESPASTDVLCAARDLGYVGEGRRALRYADEVAKMLPSTSADRTAQEHDSVLEALLEGVKSRNDLPLALEVLARMTNARARMLELQQLWINLDGAQRRSAPFLAGVRAALALEPGASDVDDLARNQLVEVLADVGLAKDAVPVTTRVQNPWMRARSEATAAEGLALLDRAAGAELARRALERAGARGFRTSVDNDKMDIDAARSAAVAALARAGAVDEARHVASPRAVDVAIGLRDKPRALAAWWKTLDPASRANVLVAAIHEAPELGDAAFLVPLCK
jgi:hypothetical protein